MKLIIIIMMLSSIILSNCTSETEQNIIELSEYNNKTYSELLEILGPPVDKIGYTVKNAPTKSWNHHELFSKYPKTIKNENIQIMEVTWDADDFRVLACFHIVDGENRCLVAKKIRKGMRY